MLDGNRLIQSRVSSWHGMMLISGTAIGAGMLGLPIATAGVGALGSTMLFTSVWLIMLGAGLMIAELHVRAPEGNSNFHTIAKNRIGKQLPLCNGILLLVSLYALSYAYCASAAALLVDAVATVSPRYVDFQEKFTTALLLFVLFISSLVHQSERSVKIIVTLMNLGLLLCFIWLLRILLPIASSSLLFTAHSTPAASIQYWFFSIPYIISSFGFHSNVPGLVAYYDKDKEKIRKSLLGGSLIALIVYLIWQGVVLSNVPAPILKALLATSGNISQLFQAITERTGSKLPHLQLILMLFPLLAIMSSYLGIALSMSQYFLDLLFAGKKTIGRKWCANVLTFVPPLLITACFPHGFLAAIKLVGCSAVFWAILIPGTLLLTIRRKLPLERNLLPGGIVVIYGILLFGSIVLLSYAVRQWLPLLTH